MRVHLHNDVDSGLNAEMLLKIGDGCLEADAEGYLSLSREFCNLVENDMDLIARVFPELQQNLSCDQWWCARAILAPKNEVVSRVNTDILKEVQGEMKEYLSIDTIIDTELSTSYPVEFLNSLELSGVPSHKLQLKLNVPVMLMRNLNAPLLCNGTRLRITKLGQNILGATILTGVGGIKTIAEENKLPLLCNYVTSNIYQFINDCTTYAQAIAILDSLFIKKRNVIFARHCLSTRNQQTEETVSEYLQILNQLSKDCDFTNMKAEEYRKEYIRDAFIRGLKCPRIRQRLLENASMTLDQAFEQARTLESAEVHAASYMGSSFPVQSAAMNTEDFSEETVATSVASSSRSQKCFFCGNDLHSRTLCLARDITCRNCGKKGHYQRVCKSRPGRNSSNVVASSNTLAAISGSTHYLQKSIIKAMINNNIQLSSIIDTGSSLSFLNEKHVAKCKLKVEPYLGKISMANSSMVTETEGVCKVNLKIENFTYQNVELLVMKDLCSEVLIGHDILNRHSSVEIGFDGNRPPLTICFLAVAQVPPVSLFSNLNPDCRPLVTKSRRQTVEDNIFMEVQKLLQEGVMEPSNSTWRAQAFVIRGENHKPRMVVDYSQTINKYTLLNAYPLPKIEEDEGLTLTYPFIDDVTVCGKDQKEHDDNLEKFMTVAKEYNLTLNEDKCTYSSNSVHLLGYIIQDGIIKPDPERLKPLRDMPVPKDSSALQRALGIDAVLTFNSLKDDVANAALATIKDDIPFRVETDSSDFAIGATLSQAGRPVAFFSRTLHASELRHSSPEKEAYAIVALETLLDGKAF
ncbi:putative retrovirus-related pol polyprotein from transposon opus [Trichonephila clavipes]|nr:putative retrovirus-related pol polyprotein from transposon opus [Trichonephila clavipes]